MAVHCLACPLHHGQPSWHNPRKYESDADIDIHKMYNPCPEAAHHWTVDNGKLRHKIELQCSHKSPTTVTLQKTTWSSRGKVMVQKSNRPWYCLWLMRSVWQNYDDITLCTCSNLKFALQSSSENNQYLKSNTVTETRLPIKSLLPHSQFWIFILK
jgi:hypothetical protein